MSVDERLAGWDRPTPEVDADGLLSRVHRTVRRRRRRRAVLGFAAVLVLLGGALAALIGDRGDTEVDTVGPGQIMPVRYLPDAVPAGFELAWVDDRDEPVAPPAEPETWPSDTATSAYAYGYRTDSVELDVDVFPGYTLDAAAAARAWQGDGDVQVMSEDPGRGAVLLESNGMQHAVMEIEGAVVRVTAHGLGGASSAVGFELLDSFVRSLRVVEEDEWQAAIAPADVAPPFGERGAGTVLIDGGDWKLAQVPYREPRSTTRDALVLRPGGTSAGEERYFADEPALGPDVRWKLLDVREQTVAWGIAAPEVAIVRFWYLDGTVEARTVPFGNNTAFAVDVGAHAGPIRQITALDAGGRPIYGETDPGRVITCPDGADRTISVPDVVGMELRAAIAAVEDVGLTVRGTGTPLGDPVEDATVTAQEPPAGTTVPAGACIGLRTAS